MHTTRMKDMASDLAVALKENNAEHAPPLALAYRHAVERRDEEDVRQQVMADAGLAPNRRTSF